MSRGKKTKHNLLSSKKLKAHDEIYCLLTFYLFSHTLTSHTHSTLTDTHSLPHPRHKEQQINPERKDKEKQSYLFFVNF